MRWKITVEYDGTPFVGWQRQDNGPSIQQCLEDAVQRFSRETPRLHGAGRTDAGVHARGQVAHLDLDKPIESRTLRDALNFHLRPHPIAVLDAEAVAPDFHARLSAIERRYLFRILNRRAAPALDAGRVWHVGRPLDAAAMAEAAVHLIGRHDFTTFRASLCQAASPVKTLNHIGVERHGDEIHLHLAARSFLHHQVRNIAGSLEYVGAGKWTPADLKAALDARDRRRGGPTAPPQGLCFMAVRYP